MTWDGWEEDRIERIEKRLARIEAALPVRLGPQPESEMEIQNRDEVVQRIVDHVNSVVEVPPVDRTQQVLTNGQPVTPDHTEIQPNGMQKAYVVLTPEERAKGFVRPVRRSYKHVGARPKYPLRDLTEEERERYSKYEYVKFEQYPRDGSSVTGRFWTAKQLKSGCGTVTTMGIALAETYARDPKFYGGTFCCGCGTHLPLEEFVWEGTSEVVGS